MGITRKELFELRERLMNNKKNIERRIDEIKTNEIHPRRNQIDEIMNKIMIIRSKLYELGVPIEDC